MFVYANYVVQYEDKNKLQEDLDDLKVEVIRLRTVCEEDRHNLLEQLLYMPGGTVSFDRHLIDADTALYSLLIDGNLQTVILSITLRLPFFEFSLDQL